MSLLHTPSHMGKPGASFSWLLLFFLDYIQVACIYAGSISSRPEIRDLCRCLVCHVSAGFNHWVPLSCSKTRNLHSKFYLREFGFRFINFGHKLFFLVFLSTFTPSSKETSMAKLWEKWMGKIISLDSQQYPPKSLSTSYCPKGGGVFSYCILVL